MGGVLFFKYTCSVTAHTTTHPGELNPPWTTGYRPAEPRASSFLHPVWEVIEQADRVVVRARTKLSWSAWASLISVTAVILGIGVAIVVFGKDPSRYVAFVPMAIGLSGIWMAYFGPLTQAGAERTLIDFDRTSGRVRLPRAGLEVPVDSIKRIERIKFGVAVEHGGSITHRHIVFAYEDESCVMQYVLLFQAEFWPTPSRIASALGVPLVDYHIGVVGADAE